MNESKSQDEKTVPFYPDHVAREAKVALGFAIVLIIIGIIGLFNPVGLEQPADPMVTPAHVKSEWYFLFLYQLLKIIPQSILGIEGKVIGVLIPVIGIVLLTLWPFIDRKPDTTPKDGRKRLIIASVLLVIITILTIWGGVS
ncbi:MAG: hypothetical protein U9Q82_01975 [Chloroflexota bacterium]|nr:hypothetical protein [Chloroflexota bacterium]